MCSFECRKTYCTSSSSVFAKAGVQPRSTAPRPAAISINGTLGWQAQRLSDLFRPQSLNANIGPSFQWNLLNYGRILNNVRLQDAQFRELVATYQETVLEADLEVENGIVTFVQAQQRADDLRKSVDEAWIALQVIVAQYQIGQGGV